MANARGVSIGDARSTERLDNIVQLRPSAGSRRPDAETPPSRAAKTPEVRHLLPPGCWSVRNIDQIHALESAWDEMAADVTCPSPFHSWGFAIEWFEHFVRNPAGGATGRFEVAVAVDERRRIIGIAPMFEEHALGRAGLGRLLQPFGRSHSMETMTDEPIVVLRRGAEDRAFAMLVDHFARRGQQGWDVAALLWYGARDDRPAQLGITRSLDHVQVTRGVAGPLFAALPGSFEAFRAGLNKSMRDNVSYYPRRIAREQKDWRIEFARDPAEIPQATAQLVALHRERSRWSEGPSHRNHIPGQREASFLTRWFQRLAERGHINVGRLFIRGELVATQAFVEQGQSLAVYYSGHAQSARRYSPLTVLASEAIRNGIGRGARRLTFSPGSEPWKTRWGAASVWPVRETSIYALRLGALLRAFARRARLAGAI